MHTDSSRSTHHALTSGAMSDRQPVAPLIPCAPLKGGATRGVGAEPVAPDSARREEWTSRRGKSLARFARALVAPPDGAHVPVTILGWIRRWSGIDS